MTLVSRPRAGRPRHLHRSYRSRRRSRPTSTSWCGRHRWALALAVMHVLIAETLLDRDYSARHARLRAVGRATCRALTPGVGGRSRLPADTIVAFARRYGASARTFLRIGIGLSRHDNGACGRRSRACRAHRRVRLSYGGALLSSTQAYTFDSTRSSASTSCRTGAADHQHDPIGRALTDPAMTPPVRALYVYDCGCKSRSRAKGLSHEDWLPAAVGTRRARAPGGSSRDPSARGRVGSC